MKRRAFALVQESKPDLAIPTGFSPLDHVLMGGYGSIVLEHFNEAQITTPVVRIGWPDQFIEHASSVDYLRNKHGLNVANTVAQAKAKLAAPAVATADFKAA